MIELLRRFASIFAKHKTPKAEEHSHNEELSSVIVTYDDVGLSLFFQGQEKQEITWKEIELISICIEDNFLPFPYWYVGNKDNLLRIPNDALGGQTLFFDGFSEHIAGYKSDATFKVIIEASGAIEGTFIVWQSEITALNEESV